MVLNDRELSWACNEYREKKLVDPFQEENLQPASIDLCLNDEFISYSIYPSGLIDLTEVHQSDHLLRKSHGRYKLDPQGFCLGSTQEWINTPNHLVGIVNGKSSLARLGLVVHCTAGFLDPGFEGNVTLEFFNCNNRPIILRPGLKICQVSFMDLSGQADRPYGHPDLGSHYQNQDGVVASKYSG